MEQLLARQIAQQVPLRSRRGAMLAQPSALGVRHGPFAQRVLACQLGPGEWLQDGLKLRRRLGGLSTRGQLEGEADHESETVLQIVLLRTRYQPVPASRRR